MNSELSEAPGKSEFIQNFLDKSERPENMPGHLEELA